jgi:hypothetical protein
MASVLKDPGEVMMLAKTTRRKQVGMKNIMRGLTWVRFPSKLF